MNPHQQHGARTGQHQQKRQQAELPAEPVRAFECNCCGGLTRGRQWWNRDTGYGMCVPCIAFVRRQGMSEAEIQELYGVEGIHWGCDA